MAGMSLPAPQKTFSPQLLQHAPYSFLGESELSRSVTLLPNPANGEVTVSSAGLLQHIEIRSTKGTLLYSEHASSHMATIDLEWLPAGTYIVTVQTMDGTTSKKLVVK